MCRNIDRGCDLPRCRVNRDELAIGTGNEKPVVRAVDGKAVGRVAGSVLQLARTAWVAGSMTSSEFVVVKF